MQVAFTKEDVVDPLKLHGSSILWLEEHRILDFDPTCAVAGITMPPLERRSPSSPPSRTRTRSCSNLIGTEPSNRGRVSGTVEAALVSS